MVRNGNYRWPDYNWILKVKLARILDRSPKYCSAELWAWTLWGSWLELWTRRRELRGLNCHPDFYICGKCASCAKASPLTK